MECTGIVQARIGPLDMFWYGVSKIQLTQVIFSLLINFFCSKCIILERRYRYPVPVTCVAFSNSNPQLLAVGLYDGSVEVIDITDDNSFPVGKSERSSSPGFEPVWQIQWLKSRI